MAKAGIKNASLRHVTRPRRGYIGGTSDLSEGELVQWDTTAGKNHHLIAMTNADVQAAGVMNRDYDYSEEGNGYFKDIITPITADFTLMYPYSITEAGTVDCTQSVSTTTMTVTSLEDDIDAGYIWVVIGNGIGELRYIDASASGSCTLSSAPSTAYDTDTNFAKILPVGHATGIPVSATMLSTAAAGSVQVKVIENWLEFPDGTMKKLTSSLADATYSPSTHKIWCEFRLTSID